MASGGLDARSLSGWLTFPYIDISRYIVYNRYTGHTPPFGRCHYVKYPPILATRRPSSRSHRHRPPFFLHPAGPPLQSAWLHSQRQATARPPRRHPARFSPSVQPRCDWPRHPRNLVRRGPRPAAGLGHQPAADCWPRHHQHPPERVAGAPGLAGRPVDRRGGGGVQRRRWRRAHPQRGLPRARSSS